LFGQMIPVGGFKTTEEYNKEAATTFKSMKTIDLERERNEQI